MLRFLVATDGSEHAAGALALVAALARRGARAHAVVLNVQPRILAGEVGAIAPASIAEEARRRAADEVLAGASALLAAAGVPHDRIVEVEESAAAIVSCARAQDCDAIVVGARGRGPVASALLGSVSGEVIRRADRPVIVIGAHEAVLPDGPLRVLAALDGSESALRALRFAAVLAGALPAAELHLLHVQTPLSVAGALLGPRERLIEHWSAKSAEETFAGARALLGEGGDPASTHVVHDLHPADAIVRLAGELGCGLLALGTRGRGPAAQLVLGSVAQAVLRRVRCPVVLAR